eukprot:snap_masked-scaffold_32-processed-gene-3.20-mRNA-1 protein AED:1.00 eAED:1.00 QI:0/0/0/0/1/1/3/0/72
MTNDNEVFAEHETKYSRLMRNLFDFVLKMRCRRRIRREFTLLMYDTMREKRRTRKKEKRYKGRYGEKVKNRM